jgi:2-oxoglutarate ferredoxin oxidoreductase subunit alpha
MPVLIISDLQLSEHPETIEPEDFREDVNIERGELVKEWNEEKQGKFHRYAMTASGVSPRSLPGTANTLYTAPTDEHDEDGVLISDVFCSWAVRRKMAEKRMKKMELALRDMPAPQLVGPADAEVTLIGWGSSEGLIDEVVDQLKDAGIRANHLQFKYILPFHSKEATEILKNCKRTICIEGNSTGQFAHHLRAQTGHAVGDRILRYDGEPFEPAEVTTQVRALLAGEKISLDVTEADAREIAYHYVRVHLGEDVRPWKIEQIDGNGYGEKLWRIEVVNRETSEKRGEMLVGVQTGSTYSWQAAK